MTPAGPGPGEWWRTAVVYQIYPRSFADGNGDGMGDLGGIRSRLPYLQTLGVDALWLSPFYPSPLADGGYDITNHRDVDPRLGTIEEFDELVAEAHVLGIKIVIDLVPNHTSDRHPWFLDALSSPHSAMRERYVFRNGTGPGGTEPPTDWNSHFGGSAWQRVDDGTWYLHLFAREQPDLNWENPAVRAYFRDTLRFWADRGVDGFRVDVAHSLAKDLSEPLRSQPHLDRQLPLDGSDPLYDRDEVHEIYRSWRQVFDEYDPPRMAVAETWHPTTSRTHLYARPDELGSVFDFSLLKALWDRNTFHRVISRSLADNADAGGRGTTWVLSSHDVPRHATRYALPPEVDLDHWLLSDGTAYPLDTDQAARRARAATLLMLALPGSAYLYQGEELGLLEVADLAVSDIRDPVWQRTNHLLKGRDGSRVPLPWTRTGSSLGFGSNGSWLPQPESFRHYSVESQDGVPGSTLELYRDALRLRRKLQGDDLDLEWLDTSDQDVLHLRRPGGWECIVNFSAHPKPMPHGQCLLASQPLGAGDTLPPECAVWLLAE